VTVPTSLILSLAKVYSQARDADTVELQEFMTEDMLSLMRITGVRQIIILISECDGSFKYI